MVIGDDDVDRHNLNLRLECRPLIGNSVHRETDRQKKDADAAWQLSDALLRRVAVDHGVTHGTICRL